MTPDTLQNRTSEQTKARLTDYFCACGRHLHVIVDDVKLKIARPENLGVNGSPVLLLDRRQPHVKLVDPVLQRVDRYDDENRASAGVAQVYVDECDHLDGFAEPHAVREYAAETVARLVPF